LLTVGGLALAGLTLPDFLQRRAHTQTTTPRGQGFGRAQAVILLYLQGSPSHIDLWDPKPDALPEIRGEFQPIVTRAPGLYLSEVLPLLAQQADKFSLIRTLGVKPRGLANHGASIYMLMTGYDPSNFSPTGLAVPPSPQDPPSIGSVVSRFRAAPRGTPSYVAVCGAVKEGAVTGVGQNAGLLGGAHNPLQMFEDPTQAMRLDAFSLPPDMTLGRLQARLDLRGGLARSGSLGGRDFDAYYEQAFSLIESNRAASAFRLDRETVPRRERYGMTRFGQSCLLARRLVEAGVRFVQVNWPAGSDTEPEPGPDGSWDTHRNNFPMLRNHRCPVFDRAVSGLLEDLHARGLLDSTLVLAVGEFGRSPKIGSPTTNNVGPGGRDHWPECYTCLIAGGGVRPGQAYGASDRNGAYPRLNPAHPYDLISTIYHAVGIDRATEYHDNLARPRRLVEHGQPLLGLF
jgi:hypothetical protein